MKKGRHRRFEEARAMKRVSDTLFTRKACDECGAASDEECASWCLARVLDDEDDEYEDDPVTASPSADSAASSESGSVADAYNPAFNARSLEPEDATP